jgi:hypothetical protein
MKGKGPRIERETVINFNEEEGIAWIWTASATVYRRLLKRLGRQYLTEDSERHAEFKFPKELISLPKVKPKGYSRTHNGLRWQAACLGPDKLSGETGKVGYLKGPARTFKVVDDRRKTNRDSHHQSPNGRWQDLGSRG